MIIKPDCEHRLNVNQVRTTGDGDVLVMGIEDHCDICGAGVRVEGDLEPIEDDRRLMMEKLVDGMAIPSNEMKGATAGACYWIDKQVEEKNDAERLPGGRQDSASDGGQVVSDCTGF